MSKLVEDYKDYAGDQLGQCKNLGFSHSGLPTDHVYGMAAARADDWGAGECIKGAYGEEDQVPDKDLGTTLRPGWRNELHGAQLSTASTQSTVLFECFECSLCFLCGG